MLVESLRMGLAWAVFCVEHLLGLVFHSLTSDPLGQRT